LFSESLLGCFAVVDGDLDHYCVHVASNRVGRPKPKQPSVRERGRASRPTLGGRLLGFETPAKTSSQARLYSKAS